MIAIKREPDGTPSLENSCDAVIILILNILYYFVGDCADIYKKIRKQLINLNVKLYLILDGTRIHIFLKFINFLTQIKSSEKKISYQGYHLCLLRRLE